MPATLAEAFAAVEGPELDTIIGYSIPPRTPAPTDAEIEAAFEHFDYERIRAMVRKLASRYRCQQADAEDAVHTAFAELLERDCDLFRGDPER